MPLSNPLAPRLGAPSPYAMTGNNSPMVPPHGALPPVGSPLRPPAPPPSPYSMTSGAGALSGMNRPTPPPMPSYNPAAGNALHPAMPSYNPAAGNALNLGRGQAVGSGADEGAVDPAANAPKLNGPTTPTQAINSFQGPKPGSTVQANGSGFFGDMGSFLGKYAGQSPSAPASTPAAAPPQGPQTLGGEMGGTQMPGAKAPSYTPPSAGGAPPAGITQPSSPPAQLSAGQPYASSQAAQDAIQAWLKQQFAQGQQQAPATATMQPAPIQQAAGAPGNSPNRMDAGGTEAGPGTPPSTANGQPSGGLGGPAMKTPETPEMGSSAPPILGGVNPSYMGPPPASAPPTAAAGVPTNTPPKAIPPAGGPESAPVDPRAATQAAAWADLNQLGNPTATPGTMGIGVTHPPINVTPAATPPVVSSGTPPTDPNAPPPPNALTSAQRPTAPLPPTQNQLLNQQAQTQMTQAMATPWNPDAQPDIAQATGGDPGMISMLQRLQQRALANGDQDAASQYASQLQQMGVGGGQDVGWGEDPGPQPVFGWTPPGQQAPADQWQYDMSSGWAPPGQQTPQSGAQLGTGADFDPTTRGGSVSASMSPPGEQAPVDALNWTPSTGEVHPPGQIAPVDQTNYSLMAT